MVWGASQEPRQYFSALCSSNTTVAGIQKKPLLAYGVPWYWCLGRQPKTPKTPNPIFFGIVQFKHHHHRYPETPLVAYEVQWYGCLRRHPRTHTIFYCMVRFKHHHFMYPETPFLARGVRRYGCLGRHPRTHSIFFGMARSNTTTLGI